MFPFASSKAPPPNGSAARTGGCAAHMFVMHVGEELPTWPEGSERQRCWVGLREASERCRHSWMREALHTWMERRGWGAAVPPPAAPAVATCRDDSESLSS